MASEIKAAPLSYAGDNPTWPRLVKFPNAKVMASANKLLAAKEKSDRKDKAECHAQVKEVGRKPDGDTYYTEISVSYLSSKFLSVSERTSYDCAAAYPTNGALAPYTIELTGGTQMGWQTAFKPGFLSEEGKPGVLTKLYRASYKKMRNTSDDEECVDVMMDRDPFEYTTIVYLDAKRGIVFEPELPHVVAACVEDFAMSPSQAAPYLRNAALVADLKATVKAKK